MPTLEETIRKVNGFLLLSTEWDFGEGAAPSVAMVSRAISLLRSADRLGVKRANAFPGTRGEIEVTFYRDNKTLELTLETDGSVTIAEDEGDKQVAFKEYQPEANGYAALSRFAKDLPLFRGAGQAGLKSKRGGLITAPHTAS